MIRNINNIYESESLNLLNEKCENTKEDLKELGKIVRDINHKYNNLTHEQNIRINKLQIQFEILEKQNQSIEKSLNLIISDIQIIKKRWFMLIGAISTLGLIYTFIKDIITF